MLIENRTSELQEGYRQAFTYVVTTFFGYWLCVLHKRRGFEVISVIVEALFAGAPSVFELEQSLIARSRSAKTELCKIMLTQPLNSMPEEKIIGVQILTLHVQGTKLIQGTGTKLPKFGPN